MIDGVVIPPDFRSPEGNPDVTKSQRFPQMFHRQQRDQRGGVFGINMAGRLPLGNPKGMPMNTDRRSDKRIKHLAFAAAIFCVISGCDDNAIEDKIVLTFAPNSTPVKVDTFCDNGGCSGEEKLTVRVEFDDDAYVAEDTEVAFEQYRIDYQLDEVSRDIPYFASPIRASLVPDDTTTVAVSASGKTQRTFVYKAVGDKVVKGTAYLTLAGYDDDDEVVMIEKSFDISFGDYVTDADDTIRSSEP
jgi:hypothetical protein